MPNAVDETVLERGSFNTGTQNENFKFNRQVPIDIFHQLYVDIRAALFENDSSSSI